MSKGISTNVSLQSQAACLAEAGIKFALRYYSKPNSTKAITPAEADALAEAGIQLGVVYQERGRSVGDFTLTKARTHATNAWNSAQAIRQPAGSAVYFAVDYDATMSDLQSTILSYFNEVNSTLAVLAGGTNPYHLGVYGSGRTCRFLRKNCPSVRYTWLSLSKGWADSRTYNEWDLNQTWGDGTLCELSPVFVDRHGELHDGNYEYNFDDGDFGGFLPGVPIAGFGAEIAKRDRIREIEFKMELGDGAELRTGLITVRGRNNNVLLEAIATSGRPGHQNSGHLWEMGFGPLPALKELTLDTEAEFPESNAQLGVRFAINPLTLRNATGGTRSGFYLRGAGPTPGTNGGIAVLHSNDLIALRRLLAGSAAIGDTSIPLKVSYSGGIENLSIAETKKLGAVFSLKLKKSSELQYGRLTIVDENGEEVYSGVATSGLAGYQHPGAFWKVGLGVVPPTDDARFIETAIWNTDAPMGTRYQITPEKVWNEDRTKSRSAFRVHFDGGTPGSAGCIVTPSRRDYDKIISLFAAMNVRGIKRIPLTLNYT